MKPERFASHLLAWLSADPQVRARSFQEARYTPCPYGVELGLPSGAVVYLQVVGRAAPGIVSTGTAAPSVPPAPRAPAAEPLPTEGPVELAAVERWVAAHITAGGSAEIADVVMFQNRTGRRSVPHGLTVTFHTGARCWVYFRHATPAGRQPCAGAVWRALPTV